MRNFFTLTVIFFCFAFLQLGCSRNSPVNLPGKLSSFFLSIDITRDTIVRTPRGAILTIPAGAITSRNSKIVKLGITEAYTISEMLLGGLTTSSNGIPLSSGGMINVFTVDDDQTKIANKINIALPAKLRRLGMKLFRGVYTQDSSIDWIDPVELINSAATTKYAAGKKVYLDNCISCHDPKKDATGPSILFIHKRRDQKWLAEFIRNSAKLIASGDKFANCIYDHWNKTAMTAFPNLTDKNLDDMYAYLDAESELVDPSAAYDFKKSYDSCIEYNLKNRKITEEQAAQLRKPYSELVRSRQGSIVSNKDDQAEKFPEMVSYGNVPSYFYKFDIDKFGWYNIDMLTKDISGYESIELLVKLTGNSIDESVVYLVLPSELILLRGGKANDGNSYCFYQMDGKIRLPLKMQAYILAMNEKNGQPWLGITQFTIGQKQTVAVAMKMTTNELIQSEIKKLNEYNSPLSTLDSSTVENSVLSEDDSEVIAKPQLSNTNRLQLNTCNCDCMLK